ncbi:MAG: hypothetical protein J2P24_19740 [Streptosporangiales bacterium]|nr:hypothetical protein [Streptosporangiales bacterium]
MTGIGDWARHADWIAIGTVAFTGATAAATLYALVQRRWERPRPCWHLSANWRGFRGIGVTDDRGNEEDVVHCTLANVGDGPAYAVRAEGRGCELYQNGSRVEPWPMIRRGKSEKFALYFKERVEGAVVVVRWTQPPRRGKVRSRVFPVEETRTVQ